MGGGRVREGGGFLIRTEPQMAQEPHLGMGGGPGPWGLGSPSLAPHLTHYHLPCPRVPSWARHLHLGSHDFLPSWVPLTPSR